LWRFGLNAWDRCRDAVRWLWHYFFLDAVLVIPVWLIVPLARVRS
jgi:hypothetical protein